MRILLALILSGLCLGWGGEVRAHAVLLETVPSDRSVVAESPSAIVLQFNETVQPIFIQIRDERGATIPTDLSMVDRELRIVPRVSLAAGSYILSYRVTSADSHPVAGSFLFAVGRAPDAWAAPTISVATTTGWAWGAGINRAIFLAATLIAIGGSIFWLVMGGDAPMRSLVLGGAGIAAVAALAGIYLQGGLLLDAAAFRPWEAEPWRIGFASTRGTAALVAIGGLAVVAGALFLESRERRPVALIGILAVIASFALSGHVATASPRWVAIPTLLFHVAVVAFWLGSLIPLLSVLHAPRVLRLAAFSRFSEIAFFVVPQLVVAGAILATLQIERPDAVFASPYGLIFALKILLVCTLFVLAACNRWILMPEMKEDSPGHADRFRRTIWAEIGLGFAILCVTAFLSQTAPPRSEIAHSAFAADAAREVGHTSLISSGARQALLMVTPARPGRNTIRVRVFGPDGQPIDPLELTVDLSNPVAGIEALHRDLKPAGDSYFDYAGPELGIAGRWIVRIEALVSDFEKSIFETELSIK